MYFVFTDDSKQQSPIRQRMGPLVAAGAILVSGDKLKDLETSIETLCRKYHFPIDDPLKAEFKWSPGPELWMRHGLVWPEREQFFLSVINRLAAAAVKAIVAIADEHYSVVNTHRITNIPLTHEQEATYLLFEMVNHFLRDLDEDAIVINDRPSQSGTVQLENKFLADSLEMWRTGTRFVQFDRIAINLLCTQSRFVRLLQCADLVTSCITAHVGESFWSPPVFAAIKPLLHSKNERIGGYGLKFHCAEHRNLYHWLLGDTTYHAAGKIYPLPFETTRDHQEPQQMESWRIYCELSKIILERRPLIATWLQSSRPGSYANGVFELRFHQEHSIAVESLSRPNNAKLVSQVVSDITGIKSEVRYSLVPHF